MRNTEQKEIPSLLERYELKYHIPESMIGPISDFLFVYCTMDKYSEKSDDGFYTVTSLYLDSPNYLFFRQKMEGVENRFNMRIRTYDDKSGIPCFFEIKHKKQDIVRKYRTAVFDEEWSSLFESPGYRLKNRPETTIEGDSNLFFQTACTHNAEPKVLTQYRRKAYISDVDDYARVTFDTELRCQPESAYKLTQDETKMAPYDDETVFAADCNVILELKCYTTRVPFWMIDLIRYFDLQRGSFSKYATSVATAHRQVGYDCADRVVAREHHSDQHTGMRKPRRHFA